MGDGVDVDGVGRGAPSLDLLRNGLCVRGCEDAYFSGGAKGGRKAIKEVGDRLGDANGSEDAGSKAGVTAEGVEESIVGSFDV